MKHIVNLLAAVILLGITSCSGLSDREKELVGRYFISEISDIEPLYELNSDGTSRMHAIRPGVVSFWVEGKWHVSGNKLVIENDPNKLHVDGDKRLVGDIAKKVEYEIADYNGVTLTLKKEGVNYEYHRRPEISVEQMEKEAAERAAKKAAAEEALKAADETNEVVFDEGD